MPPQPITPTAGRAGWLRTRPNAAMLPFPPTPSASVAGRTRQEPTYAQRVESATPAGEPTQRSATRGRGPLGARPPPRNCASRRTASGNSPVISPGCRSSVHPRRATRTTPSPSSGPAPNAVVGTEGDGFDDVVRQPPSPPRSRRAARRTATRSTRAAKRREAQRAVAAQSITAARLCALNTLP